MNWIEGIYQKGNELDRNGSKEKTNGKGGVMICHNKSDTVHPKSSSKLPFRLPWWFTTAPNRPPQSTPLPRKKEMRASVIRHSCRLFLVGARPHLGYGCLGLGGRDARKSTVQSLELEWYCAKAGRVQKTMISVCFRPPSISIT